MSKQNQHQPTKNSQLSSTPNCFHSMKLFAGFESTQKADLHRLGLHTFLGHLISCAMHTFSIKQRSIVRIRICLFNLHDLSSAAYARKQVFLLSLRDNFVCSSCLDFDDKRRAVWRREHESFSNSTKTQFRHWKRSWNWVTFSGRFLGLC